MAYLILLFIAALAIALGLIAVQLIRVEKTITALSDTIEEISMQRLG